MCPRLLPIGRNFHTPMIEVRNLTHTYSIGTPFEHTAVKDMSFTVEQGEFLGIIGHTGSGKSTLMQHLNGLLALPWRHSP